MRYDVVIIGNGIAACAALRRLQGIGLHLAVVAPARTAGFQIGESLSPAANEELRSLGYGE